MLDYQLIQSVAGGAVTGLGGAIVAVKLWTAGVERRLSKLEEAGEDVGKRLPVLEAGLGEMRREADETRRQLIALHRRLDGQRERDEARELIEAERYGRLSAQLGMLLGGRGAPAP
jgi:hypothetical protein